MSLESKQNSYPRRVSKVRSLAEAAHEVQDGMLIGIGGWTLHGHPMALVRELVRQGRRNLRLAPSASSIAPDLLIGAGCVQEVHCVFISVEHFGLAPAFRRAAESGAIKVYEMDGPGFAGALRAAACDLPFGLIPDMRCDLPRVNPERHRPYPVRTGERSLLAVAPLSPEISVIHGQPADEYGNVQLYGPPALDVLLATASKRVIATVDRIVSVEQICAAPHWTKFPAALVDVVVAAPFGAHPTASAQNYSIDADHFSLYARAGRSAETFETYLRNYVLADNGEAGYLERVGVQSLLRASYLNTKWDEAGMR